MPFGWFGRKRGRGGSRGEHSLHVYTGAFPTDEVVRFLRTGLDSGEAGLVIASRDDAFRVQQALGPQHARCVFLDAAAQLERFMVDGRPDAGRFHDVIGPALRDARRRGNGHVRAYGEMVALLAARGEHEAAVEVERLWNLILHGQPVALLCAYPMEVFAGLGQRYLAPVRHEHAAPSIADA